MRKVAVATALACTIGAWSVHAQPAHDALRVCEDPNNLPFSNAAGQGYENKIAELFARQLGLPLEYAWYPMQMGFARKTLTAYVPEKGRYKCDLIMGTTSGFDMGIKTRPYYHSTYALVYRKDSGLNIRSLDDLAAIPPTKRKSLKIGVFSGSPAVDWLLRHGFINQAVSYQAQSGSADVTPGTILQKDLASGKLNMAFVWGPIGGYFAKKLPSANLEVVPLKSSDGIKFDFGIVMATRYGEKSWRQKLQSLLEQDRNQIRAILEQYNVPLVEAQGSPRQTASN